MSKPIAIRAAAAADVEAVADHYHDEGGVCLADSFVEALQSAYRAAIARPGTGSPVLGDFFEIEGLRSQRLKRFPYRVLYVERAEHIEIWRVLHDRRDIAGLLPGADAD